MSMQQEVDSGLKFFNQILRETGRLQIREARLLLNRLAHFIRVGALDKATKQTYIVLSHEFLSDLPNTAEYQLAVRSYSRCLAMRMGNLHPMDFYCKSRIPIRVEIEWPLERDQRHDGSYVHVQVQNLRERGTVAICSVITTHQQFVFDLNRNPFLHEAAIVNTVRRAVDGQSLTFHPRDSHPVQLIEVPLNVQLRPSAPDAAVDQFVAGKVYWMGFKQGDKRTEVWIADESDADYLGTDARSLIQIAQVLEVQKVIVLDSSQEYASAGENLLSQGKSFERGFTLTVNAQDLLREEAPVPQEWDAFICHASEDKDDFVRPLAENLRNKGLRVWYDEFTLQVGDSLRREIDRGLQNSRYGVVVLSPAFFAKRWPQWELDGLVTKEMDGKKVILPVWHNVTAQDVRNYSLSLSEKVAANSAEGITAVVEKLLRAIRL